MSNAGNDADNMSRMLRPVYSALDNHQYDKAIKLCNSMAQDWDIVQALKAHALERVGKTCESLLVLEQLLGPSRALELKERLDLEVASSVSSGATNDGGSTPSPAAAAAAATTTGSVHSKPSSKSSSKSGGKKRASQKKSTAAASDSTAANAPSAFTSTAVTRPLPTTDLMLERLDSPIWQRRRKLLQEESSGDSSKATIIDETTLATIAVSLRSFKLFDTLAEMYNGASEVAMSQQKKTNADTTDAVMAILREVFFSNLRMACHCNSPSTAEESTLADDGWVHKWHVFHATTAMQCLESAQLAAMQLARHSGQNLHLVWAAQTALLHRQECQALLPRLQSLMEKDCDVDAQLLDKLRSKLQMLPRLTESLLSRVLSRKSKEDQYAPSAEEWNLYIQSLLLQEKYEEAVEALRGLTQEKDQANGANDDDDDDDATKKTPSQPKIDDEMDVRQYSDGSLIQWTQREVLEKWAHLELTHLHRGDVALAQYERLLLEYLPDQWTYWMGLYKAASLAKGKEEGMQHCRAVIEKVLKLQQDKRGDDGKPPPILRGPHLFRVELASNTDDDNNNEEALRKEIQEYITLLAPVASSCFSDVKPYLEKLSSSLQALLEWIHPLQSQNAPTAHALALKQRSREALNCLRGYITTVQIAMHVCGAAQNASWWERFVPTWQDLLNEWLVTLTPQETQDEEAAAGATEKENLPGDELALLTVQRLLQQEDSSQRRIQLTAAAILEHAISKSPYNPQLKLAAITVYGSPSLAAAFRQWTLYESLSMKHIQLDSCSYVILPHLVRSGLYPEAAHLSLEILQLHNGTSKDVTENGVVQSMDNGVVSVGVDFMTWQRDRMRPSVQLLQAKALVMDLAPLLGTDSGSGEALAARYGLSGQEESRDVQRAEKMIRDADGYGSAPSLLHVVTGRTGGDDDDDDSLFSDNRDKTIFSLNDSLSPASVGSIAKEAYRRAHVHGILIRSVLLLKMVKPPKKGKVISVNPETDWVWGRSASLLKALQRARPLFVDDDDLSLFWKVLQDICRALAVVGVGMVMMEGSTPQALSEDSTAAREAHAVEYLQGAAQALQQVRPKDDDDDAGSVVPLWIVPWYVLIESVSRLWSNAYGWTKRKRDTKVASGALARLARALERFVTQVVEALPAGQEEEEEEPLWKALLSDEDAPSLGKEWFPAALETASKFVLESYRETQARILPLLQEIQKGLATYNQNVA